MKIVISAVSETQTDYVEPGGKAIVNATTSPSALVGFLAMDEGLVLLAGSQNDFSMVNT